MKNNMNTSSYPQAEGVCAVSNHGAVNDSMAEPHFPNVPGTRIPKRTLKENETRQTFEEALILAAGQLKSDPRYVVMPSPIDENAPLQPLFDNSGIIVGRPAISNNPNIYSDLHDNINLWTIEDCKRIAAEFKASFAQKGIDNVDVGYSFTLLEADMSYGDCIDVELYLSGDVECLSAAVERVNEKAKEGGEGLCFDMQSKTIMGAIKILPVKGGIFARRRIIKTNKEVKAALRALIEQAIPFLAD